jgi:hypothetical protein
MTIGIHNHVSDMSGVTRSTIKHAPIKHDAATHSGANYHANKVGLTFSGTQPSFG